MHDKHILLFWPLRLILEMLWFSKSIYTRSKLPHYFSNQRLAGYVLFFCLLAIPIVSVYCFCTNKSSKTKSSKVAQQCILGSHVTSNSWKEEHVHTVDKSKTQMLYYNCQSNEQCRKTLQEYTASEKETILQVQIILHLSKFPIILKQVNSIRIFSFRVKCNLK